MFLKGKHSDLAMLSLEDELMSLERMVEVPPLEDLICISQKCRKEKNLECAKRLHSHICNNKLETHGPLGNYLVPMFVECASLSDAEQVFDRLPHRNKYSWNSLIQGYIECGESEQALDLFQQMQELSVHPNAHTLQALLKACARGKWLETGQGVHAVIAKEGFEMEPFVCGTLVDMYAKCGALAEAQEVFGGLPTRDIVLWTALIAGYVEHGLAEEALNCSREMQLEGISPDAVTFVCTLKACGNIGAIDRGREIHAEICLKGLEKGTIVGSTVVDMYAKCRSLAEAQEVFDGLLARDVVSWTALITCYAEYGLGEEVLKCLEHMRLEGISPNAVTYVCSLKTCDSIKTIDKGRELHSEIVKEGFDRDAFVGSSLLDIYAKCGSLAEAQKVFYSLPVQDVVSWTALIAGYAEHGFVEEALNCLEHMRSKGMHPNAVTFVCILKACGSARATGRGQETHNEICKKGFERDSSVWIILVEMYTKCGSFVEAHGVFDELLVRDAASWNVLIVGYVEQGLSEKALEFLEKMLLEGVSPNAVTFTHTLKACGSMGDMDRGQEIHAKISLDGFEGNPFVGNALVDMYAKCGSLLNAQEVFDELPVRDVVSWNTLLSGYVEHGHGEEALIHLNQMHLEGIILSSVTFVCSLKACSIVGAIERGQELHAEVAKEEFERDPFVAASLVDVYVKCGFLAEAREVFDELPVRDVILWTALIAGYAEHGLDEEALECMGKMQLEGVARNSVTCVCGLKACGNLGFVDKGREIHDEIAKKGFERDPFVGSALVDMYAKCVSLAEAREVFDKLASRDIVSWNVLVAGYAENNYGEEVLRFLDQIKEEGTSPNSATYTSCLKACNSLGAIDIGRELHADIIKEEYEGDPCVGRMLVDMYAKCNSLAEAREVFDQLSVRNVASWNALMAAYTDQGLGEETLNCFEMMQLEGMLPDAVTLVCTLKACGCIGAVDKGCEIQMSVSKEDFEGDPVLGNAVVDMYAKCGSLAKAQEVFDKLPARDVVSWSSLLAGYARLGKSDIVFDLFERMEEERIQPDGITFLSILTVCSHVGLVDKGQTFFEVMRRDYGIIPSIEHHNCMLDLFGRTGQLGEVVEFFENKLFQPNIGTWITVLGACQRWGYVELGNHAFECALRLEDKQAAAAFILMSNIHADAHGAD